MDSQPKNMMNPAIIYAGIIGGIYILDMVVIDAFNINFTIFDNLSKNLIILAGLVIAIWAFRKEYNNNYITYNRALGFGVLVSFFFAVITSVFMLIFVKYIDQDYMILVAQRSEEKLLRKGMSPDMVEATMERLAWLRKPFIQLISGIIVTTLLGTVISLIAAAFIKKDPPDPFTDVV
jgi:hypothetical protein